MRQCHMACEIGQQENMKKFLKKFLRHWPIKSQNMFFHQNLEIFSVYLFPRAKYYEMEKNFPTDLGKKYPSIISNPITMLSFEIWSYPIFLQ